MANTSDQYNAVIKMCRDLFEKKMSDYGAAWRILRLPSLTDQLFIKAQRIRGLQQNTEQKVAEGEIPEFIGIINYAVMALIQMEKGTVEQPDMDVTQALVAYDKQVALTKSLMEAKNGKLLLARELMRIIKTCLIMLFLH